MGKIAVCASGDNLDSKMDGRFGRCAYLILWNEDSQGYETVPNAGSDRAHGSGTSTAQTLVSLGASRLVVSRIGPKAFEVLKSAGIKVYSTDENQSVRAALDKLRRNDLQEMQGPND